MSSSHVISSVEGNVGTICLNRPEKRNALSGEMVSEIRSAVERFSLESTVRAIVIRGNGPAFCAGADLEYLKELSEFSIEENLADSASLSSMFRSIVHSAKPVIARVHGHAVAGGAGLVAACDVSLAVESAKLGFTEVKIGFVPAVVSVLLIRRAVQTSVRELLFTGKLISASEAIQRGLVSRVVDNEAELDRELGELLKAISVTDATAVKLTKELFNQLEEMSFDAGLDYASKVNAMARMTDGCREGIQKFLDRN